MRELVDAPPQEVGRLLRADVDEDALGDEDRGAPVVDVALGELLLQGRHVRQVRAHLDNRHHGHTPLGLIHFWGQFWTALFTGCRKREMMHVAC